MRTTERLGLAFVAASGLLALAGVVGGTAVMTVLLLIVLLVLSQLMLDGADQAVRGRVQVFLLLGGLAFVAIVVQRVRDVLN